MRHISLTILTLAFVAVLIPPYATLAENEAEEVYWNQFRGPNGDGRCDRQSNLAKHRIYAGKQRFTTRDGHQSFGATRFG